MGGEKGYMYVYAVGDLRYSVLPPPDTFSEDFFLTYPAFMSVSDLCDGLLHRYRCQPDK